MRKIFLISLLILIALSIGVVSASENITAENTLTGGDGISSDVSVDDTYNAKITAKVEKTKDAVKVIIKDNDDPYNNAIVDKIKYKFDNGATKSWDDYEDGNNGATYYIPYKLSNGKHKLTLSIEDFYFKAKPLTLNFELNKKIPTLKAIKTTTTSKEVTLKASVKYYGKNINEGKVTFKIKGKTYTVNVKNGVAVKKLKISNGYHKYSATFKSSNYFTKSSSNYAIKGKKYYIIKAKGIRGETYTAKIPFKKYLKLVESKMFGDFNPIFIKTGKKAKFIGSKDLYRTKTFYTWKKIKVLDYESFWDYGESYSYSTSKYYSNGWTYVGGYSKTFSDGYEHYSIFKKKVKTTKKVYVGSKETYSSKSYPIRFSAFVNENGKLWCRWDISRENQLKASLSIAHWSGRL